MCLYVFNIITLYTYINKWVDNFLEGEGIINVWTPKAEKLLEAATAGRYTGEEDRLITDSYVHRSAKDQTMKQRIERTFYIDLERFLVRSLASVF